MHRSRAQIKRREVYPGALVDGQEVRDGALGRLRRQVERMLGGAGVSSRPPARRSPAYARALREPRAARRGRAELRRVRRALERERERRKP